MSVPEKVSRICIIGVCVAVCVLSAYVPKSIDTPAEEVPEPAEVKEKQKEETVNPASAYAPTEEKAPDGGGYYILKSYMNRIAVYRVFGEGTRVLAEVVDTDVSSLPAQDIESLEKGIVVYTKEALVRLLEDFTS